MKTIGLLLICSSFLASDICADTFDEAEANLRKEIKTALTNKELPSEVRAALQRMENNLPSKKDACAAYVRMLLEGADDVLPEKLEASGKALLAAYEQELEERVKALEISERKILEEFFSADDGAALEALLTKATQLAEEASRMNSPRAQEIPQTLQWTQQLLREWMAVARAQAEGKPKEVLSKLSAVRYQTESNVAGVGSKLHEKIRRTARAVGLPNSDEAEKDIRSLLDRVLAASVAKEIDPILGDLRQRLELWKAAAGIIDQEIPSLAERATRFAKSWQDYLAARTAGSSERIRAALDGLTRDDLNLPGISRAMLLERSLTEAAAKPGTPASAPAGGRSPSRFEEIFFTCKTLADLEKTLPALEEAASKAMSGPQFSSPYSDNSPLQIMPELRALEREYQDAKAAPNPALPGVGSSIIPMPALAPGNRPFGPSSPMMRNPRPEPAPPAVMRALRQELTLLVLAKQFGEAAQPSDGPATYLHRHFVAARERNDWPAVKRVIETATALAIRNQICLPADAEALTQYLAAINYSEAGVARLAVASFLAALKTGSDNVPLDDIKTRLARIQQEQASEFAEGLAIAQRGDPLNPK